MWRVALIGLGVVVAMPSHAQTIEEAMAPEAAPALEVDIDDETIVDIEDLEHASTSVDERRRPVWKAQGPGPILNGQIENVDPNNEVVGGLHTVVAHSHDPDILYVGAINGGIWRTNSATEVSPNWKPLTDHLTSLSIGALERDPNRPHRLLAGIGRFSNFARRGGQLSGLLLSRNGGDTWTEITDPLLVGENFSGVAIRGNVLLAAANGFLGTAGGLFRSTDLGRTWKRVSGSRGLPRGAIFDLVRDSLFLRRFYVTVQGKGIYAATTMAETGSMSRRTT